MTFDHHMEGASYKTKFIQFPHKLTSREKLNKKKKSLLKTPQGCVGGNLLVTSHTSAKDSISLSILIGLLDVPVVVVVVVYF